MNGRIIGAGLAALLAVGVAGPAAAATGGEWVQSGYNAANTAYNPDESVINAKTVGKLKTTKYASMAPSDTSCMAPTAPVVSAGRMFLPDADGVSAYSASTGVKLWQSPKAFDEEVGPRLAVGGNTLIGATNFCFSNSDSDGSIIALDTKTGAKKWSTGRDTPYDNLVVEGGLVIAAGEEFAADYGAVTAYRLADGKVMWERVDYEAANGVSAAGRLLLAKSEGAGSMAVSAATGAKLWSVATKWIVLSATPSGDKFFVTDDQENLVALRAGNGGKVWSVAKAGGAVSNDGRHVFVARGSVLTSYDAATGKKTWSRNLGGTVGRPIRAGGLVWATVYGKPMAILNAANGKVAANGKPYAFADRDPVVTGGRLYLIDGAKARIYTP